MCVRGGYRRGLGAGCVARVDCGRWDLGLGLGTYPSGWMANEGVGCWKRLPTGHGGAKAVRSSRHCTT